MNPRTVAVVGVSEKRSQLGQWKKVKASLEARGARVFPVNPKRPDILGVPTIPSVKDAPCEIDLAIVLVRDPLPVLEECLQAGVRAAVVFAAGFGEVGTPEGIDRERQLARLASGPMRVIGPNTNTNLYESWRQDLPGRRLAIITQSGHQGRPLAQGESLGIPIHAWATLGNEVDLEFADFAAHFASHPQVGAIAAYVEGFKDGRTMMLAADRALQQKVPIVLIKVGRSEEGRRMAQSHTGHLVGDDEVHQAVFDQYGITRVDDLDDLLEVSAGMARLPLLERPAVCIYGISGGSATHLADLCGAAGLEVPRLHPDTLAGLRELIPWYVNMDNPVDSGGGVSISPEGARVLDLLSRDPNTCVTLVAITGTLPGMETTLIPHIVEQHAIGRKPIAVVWGSPDRSEPGYRALLDAGLPLFHSFTSAVRTLKARADYSRLAERWQSPFATPEAHAVTTQVREEAATMLGAPEGVDELDARRLLSLYGIPGPRERRVADEEEALAAAREIGFPVVLKVASARAPHKSDHGLVAPGLASEAALSAACAELRRHWSRSFPDSAPEGFLVQEHVADAVAEAMVGITHREPFGSTVAVGLGGVFVEWLRDLAYGVPPFGRAHARRMVRRLRAFPLLDGARGRPKADVDALVEAVLALERMALDLGPRLAELDVNPLMVRRAGRGVVAVDALVVGRRMEQAESR